MEAARTPAPAAVCTCAIVSTSGILLQHTWSREIDATQVVIRFGTAPLQGFERHVGSRTSIRVFNGACSGQTGVVLMPELSRLADHEPDTIFLYFMSEEVGQCTDEIHRFHASRRNAYFIVPSTSIVDDGRRAYPRGELPLRREIELLHHIPGRDGFSKMPSSGFTALHYFLVRGMCDQVGLFGFDSTQNVERNTPYHYWEALSSTNSIATHYNKRANAHSIVGMTPAPMDAAQRWPLALGEVCTSTTIE